ncbi:MAG TPA: hypothetical protein EYP32_01755, partial [Aquificaceae bacterium]|nr:hypothetical protein [Aquificaceae bacterium]
MPKVPKGKVGMYVYIDKKLYEELRALVKAKYPYLRGGLSREVEAALWYWVRVHTQKHTNAVMNLLKEEPKVYKVFQQVKDYFRQKYKFIPYQVTL